MNFSSNKPIYLQIANSIEDKVLSGELKPNERVMSVREVGVEYEVNVNTAMRSIDFLAGNDIIFNKRGIGYFVAEDAREKIIDLRRRNFLKNEINYFFKQLSLLSIDAQKLTELYNDYLNGNKNS